MFKKFPAFFLVSSLILGGCASQGNWTPTVDPHGDANAAQIEADKTECKRLATEASGGTATETGKGALAGGLLGAGAGAVLGAATGSNIGTSAAVGAAIGGIGGGASQGLSAEESYKKAFINCMKNRGHNVINP
jgi:hypothetical protein